MLLKLAIENYALIDRLDIDFSEGFSVITGETGAGKSILLGALGLLLGQRADTTVLLNKERKCVVEGSFHTATYGLASFFDDNELDKDDHTVLRREINPAGKSRAFINDTPVNLTLLKELGDRLVNVHSQNSITTLNDANFQLAVIDSYADNLQMLHEFREHFLHFRKMKKELEEMMQRESQARSEQDYHVFLYNELDAAGLRDDEQEEAEQRLELLTHSEEIKEKLVNALEVLNNGELNVISGLSAVAASLHQISAFHPGLGEIYERLQSDLIDIKDIASGIEGIEENVQFDPAEMEHLTARLDLIYHLQRKHNVNTVSELVSIHKELAGKLELTESISGKIEELRKDIKLLEKKLDEQSSSLTKKRKKVCPEIEEKVTALLLKLGMPHGRFSIEVSSDGVITADGRDHVKFLFSANKGIALNDVSKIASGGELSRLMLSIKSLISRKNLLPTILFDEIDSGVSGEVAGKVGNILRGMGSTMQVIAITHLPQIAGQGSEHYLVFKKNDNGTTRSCIRKLTREERVTEIAKMLSNEKVTDAALVTARELLLN